MDSSHSIQYTCTNTYTTCSAHVIHELTVAATPDETSSADPIEPDCL